MTRKQPLASCYRAQSCSEPLLADEIATHVPTSALVNKQSPEAHWSELLHAPPSATAGAHVPLTQFAPATHGFFCPDVSPGAGVKPKQLWPVAAGAVQTKVAHTAVPAQSLSRAQLAPMANGAPHVWLVGSHARPAPQLTLAQLWPLCAYAVHTAEVPSVPTPAQ